MNKTNQKENIKLPKILVDTEELKYILSCGRETALQIGEDSQAKVCYGRRIFWNVKKVQEFLDSVAA